MQETIGHISFAFAALFGFLLILMLLQNTKKKSLKVRKKIKARRSFYSIAAGLFLLVGLALRFLDFSASELKSFISTTSPVEAYTAESGAAEAKYQALPGELFALGDDYYVRTVDGDVYGYLQISQTTEDEEGNETTVQSYQTGLFSRDAVQLSGGENLIAALSERGVLRVSGAFEYLTYEKDRTVFDREVYSRNCTYVSATSNSLFYVHDGDLWSAGYNAFGKLGDGTSRNRLEGAMVLEDVASVSASETHTLAVDVYGNLYGFGDNSYSEMGNRTTAQTSTPEKLMTGVKQAAAGRYFSIVLTKNGEVYSAGRNDQGQLGTGDDRDYATYKKILDGVVKIAVNKNSCAALTASGILYVWGANGDRQLGLGDDVILTPTQVATDVYDMAIGESSMGVIKLNRDVYVTGSARQEKNNVYLQPLWQFNATVPEEYLYRETVVMPSRPE